MKVTLYLMTQKGYEVLKALIDKDFQLFVSEVIIGQDKNIDNDFSNEIKSLCGSNNIKCFNRNENCPISSDYSIAISWRWLIVESSSKLIVFHDSLLPKYRGFAPLVSMLINRDNEIGVSAIFASKEYDQGDIIDQSSTIITYPIKISKAISIISQNYIELAIKILTTLIVNGKINSTKQDEKQASYSLWREENDYLIDWSKDSEYILNFINAVSAPYKGASTYICGFHKIRVLDAEVVDDVKIENRDAGKLIFVKNKYPIIVCGSGVLKLTEVIDDQTKESVLPFKNFRIRLTNFHATK